MLSTDLQRLELIFYQTVGLSQLNEVFELMESGKIAGRYVLDTSKYTFS